MGEKKEVIPLQLYSTCGPRASWTSIWCLAASNLLSAACRPSSNSFRRPDNSSSWEVLLWSLSPRLSTLRLICAFSSRTYKTVVDYILLQFISLIFNTTTKQITTTNNNNNNNNLFLPNAALFKQLIHGSVEGLNERLSSLKVERQSPGLL